MSGDPDHQRRPAVDAPETVSGDDDLPSHRLALEEQHRVVTVDDSVDRGVVDPDR